MDFKVQIVLKFLAFVIQHCTLNRLGEVGMNEKNEANRLKLCVKEVPSPAEHPKISTRFEN
jgi:hypothetical protein